MFHSKYKPYLIVSAPASLACQFSDPAPATVLGDASKNVKAIKSCYTLRHGALKSADDKLQYRPAAYWADKSIVITMFSLQGAALQDTRLPSYRTIHN